MPMPASYRVLAGLVEHYNRVHVVSWEGSEAGHVFENARTKTPTLEQCRREMRGGSLPACSALVPAIHLLGACMQGSRNQMPVVLDVCPF